MRLLHVVVAVHLAAAAVILPGCFGGECADCGSCGIAGPNGVDAIEAPIAGKDTDGVAALEIIVSKEGMCGTDGASFFLLRWQGGAAMISAASPQVMIDSSVVTGGGTMFSWTDRDLQMTVDQTTTERATYTFTEAGKSAAVLCSLVGAMLVCTPA